MKPRATALLAVTTFALIVPAGFGVSRALAIAPIAVHDGVGSIPNTPAAACILEPAPVSPFAYVYSLPYYFTSLAWRIPRQSCAACPSPSFLTLRTVEFRIRWERIPCSAQVDISLVGAAGDLACPSPDPSRVLCGPVTYTLETNDEGDNYEFYTLDMPPGCCVSQDAFVFLKFTGFDSCFNTSNNLTTGITASTAACVNCEEFVTVANESTTPTDWCPENQPNSLWVQVQADCCNATPARNHSWGHVKSIYR